MTTDARVMTGTRCDPFLMSRSSWQRQRPHAAGEGQRAVPELPRTQRADRTAAIAQAGWTVAHAPRKAPKTPGRARQRPHWSVAASIAADVSQVSAPRRPHGKTAPRSSDLRRGSGHPAIRLANASESHRQPKLQSLSARLFQQLLERKFGGVYLDYKSRVRRCRSRREGAVG
jgi:hypothetical protein